MQSIFREIQEILGIEIEPPEILETGIFRDYLKTKYGTDTYRGPDLEIEWKIYKDIPPEWQNPEIFTTIHSDWFIERHWNDLGIINICRFQKSMSESFIEKMFKYLNKQDWFLLACGQKNRFSKEFIKRNKKNWEFF